MYDKNTDEIQNLLEKTMEIVTSMSDRIDRLEVKSKGSAFKWHDEKLRVWEKRILDDETKSRQARYRLCPVGMISEIGWDILLGLYSDTLEGRQSQVKTAKLASNAPHATAARWIHVLEKQGLITKTPSPNDERVIFVHLTPLAISEMKSWMAWRKNAYDQMLS